MTGKTKIGAWVADIEKATLDNDTFRTVLFTGTHTQLTVMRLHTGEEIGREVARAPRPVPAHRAGDGPPRARTRRGHDLRDPRRQRRLGPDHPGRHLAQRRQHRRRRPQALLALLAARAPRRHRAPHQGRRRRRRARPLRPRQAERMSVRSTAIVPAHTSSRVTPTRTASRPGRSPSETGCSPIAQYHGDHRRTVAERLEIGSTKRHQVAGHEHDRRRTDRSAPGPAETRPRRSRRRRGRRRAARRRTSPRRPGRARRRRRRRADTATTVVTATATATAPSSRADDAPAREPHRSTADREGVDAARADRRPRRRR